MPCKSVNSLTMRVVRSHFAFHAAYSALSSPPQFFNQRDDSLRLLEIRAELGLECDVAELALARFKL